MGMTQTFHLGLGRWAFMYFWRPPIVGFWTNYNPTAQHISDHTKLREVVTKMIKAISTYFPAITREEKERKELKGKQVVRALTEMKTKVASIVLCMYQQAIQERSSGCTY